MVVITACSTDMDHAGVQSELIVEAIKSFFHFKTHPPIQGSSERNYFYIQPDGVAFIGCFIP
ncbi:hypothetical protein VHA_002304 [Grimontia hollisae CIP 101886]|uniref:Uncharacterized protein n=1 Tax=Grimontia hollisae CIP 101886 TaxID=675812 RepID=D0I8W7_GRIHO|nr:hypothetical protein VHA_002304 [Grimontia hollisae CIP 101886]